jgi:predicted nucleotidyltransferase
MTPLANRRLIWRIGWRNLCRRALMPSRLCASSITTRTRKAKRMLTSDFKEFAALLNLNQVEYLIVGGYALAAYGHPRYTGDLDFWIGTAPTNADKVLLALSQFGFAGMDINKQDLTTPDQVIQLGFPPGRIDLLTSIDGVDFESCYQRRLAFKLDGIDLNFIALEDFKINKKATGRLKDVADLEALDQNNKPLAQ